MSSISDGFARLRSEGRKGLIPFITAGHPDLETTEELLRALARGGADLIELGVPFSDPIADGPVIQRASEHARQNRISVSDVLELVRNARREISVPLVIFSYLNPLLQFGVSRFALEAAHAGVDGVLVTDLPLEEADEFSAELSAKALDLIFLVAPTSSDERLRLIADKASGFIYAVSRTGVTGAAELSGEAEKLVARVRTVTDLPVAVGFGISTAAQVAEVWRYADAAVVGSAIVAEIQRNEGRPDLVQRVEEFVHSLAARKIQVSSV
ncbi:MAG TPA: tryptophan synthase subunit alpha [Pyrinomonadaceae bacterium]|nr:tryptophan synthase subunit alpha [Pyrinomonadaceae bacterium]